MKELLLCLACALFFAIALDGQPIEYPNIKPGNHLDTLFNQIITDKFRSLEDPNSSSTQTWLEAQEQLAKKELRKADAEINSFGRMDHFAYTRYTSLTKKRAYYYALYYTAGGTPGVYYQKSPKGDPELLVDPLQISTKDQIRIDSYEPSKDSKYLAIEYSRNGSDWKEIKVMDIKSGKFLDDRLKNVKYSSIAWRGHGFYYTKYPDHDLGQALGAEVYYHKVGEPQLKDELIFKRKDAPENSFSVLTTDDEQFMILVEHDRRNGLGNIFCHDFEAEIPGLRPLLMKLSGEEQLNILGSHKGKLIALSYKDADQGMLISIDPEEPRKWKTVVPEIPDASAEEILLLEEKILVKYLTEGIEKILFFDYSGSPLQSIDIPFGYSADNFSGEYLDKKLIFAYSGYTQPKLVYQLDLESYKMKPLGQTLVNFDPSDFARKQLDLPSTDGTMIPVHIFYKKNMDFSKPHPTLLSAYGGFGIVVKAHFQPGIVHFLEEGGIYAVARIRGGGEKGLEWARQGRGKNKQQSFDDFIAAAEYLIDQNYTSPDQLAIKGTSNGGLVVAVAMTQRPELFKVVVPIVSPFDMLRFQKFTVGHFHTGEYGAVEDSLGFQSLLSYSPLHNIEEQINYPATLIMTGENDDRVPPLHSYKFAAKLQSRPAQKNPVLLRVAKDAGHYGTFSSFHASLQERAQIYDFILYHLKN